MAATLMAGPTVFSSTPQSFTVPTGTDLLIVSWVEDSWGAPARPNASCTWNGVGMTRLNHIPSGVEYGCALFYMFSPAVGTYNVAVSFTNMGAFYGGISAWSQIDTTQTPNSDSVYSNGSSSSRTVTGWQYGLVHAIHGRYYFDGSFSWGGGMTQEWNTQFGPAGSHGSAGGRVTTPVTGNNTVAASWTSGPDDYYQILAAFKPLDPVGAGPYSPIGLDGSSRGPSMRSRKSAIRSRDPSAYY